MIKINKYSIKGVKDGELSLPSEFVKEINLSLLSQAVRVYEERGHVGLRHTKTRSEVNRTTKKLYKQKGTGGARHGSRRANVFVGGGITFGPRAIRRELNLTAALKSIAKSSAFAYKADRKTLVAVDGISQVQKTKTISGFLTKLAEDVKSKRFTIVVSEKNKNANKFVRNLANATSVSYKDVNAFDIVRGGVVILDSDIFENIKKVEKETKKVTK